MACRIAVWVVVFAWAGAAVADVYGTRNSSGSMVFTDAPTDPGYALVIREDPPVLPWRDVAERLSEKAGLDPDLVRAVIYVESGEDPKALSPKGAQGLMQLMPGTAQELGVTNAFRPRENIRGGVSYLAEMLERFDGRVDLALAAYNAGPGAVEKHGGIPPYPETQAYVKRVLEIYELVRADGG